MCMQCDRAVVRLDYILENAKIFRSIAENAKFCAVVKADAYGHGAAQVAAALLPIADTYAVSLIEEGIQLRFAGIGKEILVLTPPLTEEEVLRGAFHGLTLTIGDEEDYRLIRRVCERNNVSIRCHLKVNTGMNRYGFDREEFERFLRSMFTDFVEISGIYSHFYCPEDQKICERQFSLFQHFCNSAEDTFGMLVKHIAATGGTLLSRRYHLDMVRIGIGLYGYLPSGFRMESWQLKPALKLYGTVANAREYRAGGAGYGKYNPQAEFLSVCRAGYADGFFRKEGAFSGNALCMDAVVLEGRRKKYEQICLLNDAEEYAKKAGTISYEVLTKLSGRIVREYSFGEGQPQSV